jgi:hypothetical protein
MNNYRPAPKKPEGSFSALSSMKARREGSSLPADAFSSELWFDVFGQMRDQISLSCLVADHPGCLHRKQCFCECHVG